jgi:hypothetical protein
MKPKKLFDRTAEPACMAARCSPVNRDDEFHNWGDPRASCGGKGIALLMFCGEVALTWQKQGATSHPAVESTEGSATPAQPCSWNCWTTLQIPSAWRLGTHLARKTRNRIVQMVVPSGPHSLACLSCTFRNLNYQLTPSGSSFES